MELCKIVGPKKILIVDYINNHPKGPRLENNQFNIESQGRQNYVIDV